MSKLSKNDKKPFFKKKWFNLYIWAWLLIGVIIIIMAALVVYTYTKTKDNTRYMTNIYPGLYGELLCSHPSNGNIQLDSNNCNGKTHCVWDDKGKFIECN